jgi:hypothetical protein
MTKIAQMTDLAIHRFLMTERCDMRRAEHLVEHFRKAAVFLVSKIETDGWHWRSNYLREHAGCAFGAQFTNTLSPYINELLFRQYPVYRKYAADDERGLFD